MNSSFLHFIKSIVELPKEQEEKFSALLSIRKIKKNEDFISAGELPKTMAFVKKRIVSILLCK